MARKKTVNTPDLSALLEPRTPIMVAVEHAVLRGQEPSRAAAPVAEQIAVRIAGLITMDRIHSGQRLLEKDIGEVLQVSRAPVREALRILERERLVQFNARRGAIVMAPDAQDVDDIYVVRSALYDVLLRQLMQTRADDLDVLFAHHMPRMAAAVTARSVDDYALESFLLNMAIFDLSPNRLLADLLASISLRVLRYVRVGLNSADPERLAANVTSWRAFQRAVARRDIDGVLSSAARRIATSKQAAQRALVAPAAAADTGVKTDKTAAAPARSTPSTSSRPASKQSGARRRSTTRGSES